MAIDLTSNEIFNWLCEEGSGTALGDASGNSRGGTLTNGPTWTTGKWGNAVSQDGTNDCIVLPHSSVFNGLTAVSGSVWCKLSSWSSATLNSLLCKQDNATGYPSFDMRGDLGGSSTAHEISLTVGTTGYTASGPLRLQVGYWYHLGFSWNGVTGALRAWANGVPGATTTTATGTMANSTSDLWVGGNPSFGSRHTAGVFKGIRFWARELNADEWQALCLWPLRGGVSVVRGA